MSEKSRRKNLVTAGCGKISSYYVRFASSRKAIRVVDKVK
jgi:hypothetical protein